MCYTVGPCWLSILYIVVLHPFSGSLHNSELYKLQGSLIPVSYEEHGFEAGISGNAPCFLTAGPWTSDLTSRSLSYFILRGKLLSHVQLFATPWTVTCQAPVYWILQAKIHEWVALLFSMGSSQSRDRTQVSRITGGFFTVWATREAHLILKPGF